MEKMLKYPMFPFLSRCILPGIAFYNPIINSLIVMMQAKPFQKYGKESYNACEELLLKNKKINFVNTDFTTKSN